MANREREDNIYYARLAEQGERYEDMIRYMKEVASVSHHPPTLSAPGTSSHSWDWASLNSQNGHQSSACLSLGEFETNTGLLH